MVCDKQIKLSRVTWPHICTGTLDGYSSASTTTAKINIVLVSLVVKGGHFAVLARRSEVRYPGCMVNVVWGLGLVPKHTLTR